MPVVAAKKFVVVQGGLAGADNTLAAAATVEAADMAQAAGNCAWNCGTQSLK